MKKNRNLILAALLILAIGIGLYFLFKDDSRNMNAASSSSSSMEFNNIDMKETSGINELKQALVELAANQKKSIEKGLFTPKTIVEAEIINEQ